jgi:hypothetical protein
LRWIGDPQNRCLLEIRLGRSTQGRGDQQIKQGLARNCIAVTAYGFSRDNPTDEFVLDNALARRTAITETPLDYVCIGRHQVDPRSILQIKRAIGRGVLAVFAGFRKSETFIANSTQGSQTLELA